MLDIKTTGAAGQVTKHDVEWDDERITRFWDFVSEASHDEYFSSKYASEIASEIYRRVSPVGVVLDVGCGGGHLLGALRHRGADVMGVDSSPASIDWARKVVPDVEPDALIVGSMTALPIPDSSVDTVALIEVVEHALDDDLGRILSETLRVLKPGGHIFITTRNAEDLESAMVMCPDCGAVFHRMQHLRSWTAGSLGAALTNVGFVAVEARPHHFIGQRRMLERWLRSFYYRVIHDAPDLVAVARRPSDHDADIDEERHG